MKPIAASAAILAVLALGACATGETAGGSTAATAGASSDSTTSSAKDEGDTLKIRRLGVLARMSEAGSKTELPDVGDTGEVNLAAAAGALDFQRKAGRQLDRDLGAIFDARVYDVTKDVGESERIADAFAVRKLDAVLLVTFRPGVYPLQVENEAGELVTPEGAEGVYDVAGMVTAELYGKDTSILFFDHYYIDFGAYEMPADAASVEATLADAYTNGEDALDETYEQIVNGVIYGQKGDEYVRSKRAEHMPWTAFDPGNRREMMRLRLDFDRAVGNIR